MIQGVGCSALGLHPWLLGPPSTSPIWALARAMGGQAAGSTVSEASWGGAACRKDQASGCAGPWALPRFWGRGLCERISVSMVTVFASHPVLSLDQNRGISLGKVPVGVLSLRIYQGPQGRKAGWATVHRITKSLT